jgi:hypothetical protein
VTAISSQTGVRKRNPNKRVIVSKMLYAIQVMRAGGPWFEIKKWEVQCGYASAEIGNARLCYIMLKILVFCGWK